MSAHTLTSLDYYRDPDPPAPVRESHDWFANPGPFVPLGGALMDAPPFGWRGTSGTTADHKGGRNLPVFWSELDLRWYRVLARHLDNTNSFAIGFLNHLVNFTIGKGYGWQACRKGVKKTPYQTVGTTKDPLIAKAQQILDSWRDANQWPIKSRQAYRVFRREGEVFGRFFNDGWDNLANFRLRAGEMIGSPTGDTDGPASYGIETDPEDVNTRWKYHEFDPARPGELNEWVPADRMIHIACNVDTWCVKRGVPDFLPMGTELEGIRQLLRAMLDTSNEQAKIAWMEKFPNAVVEQVRGLVPLRASQEPQYNTGLSGWPYTGQQSLYSLNGFRASRVIRVEGTREFEPGPTSAGVANFLLVEQACLRACCARWGMPENFTSDASNNNFASILAAGTPFVRAIEGAQLEWGAGWERPIALKVLDFAVEAGLLTESERRQLDVEVTDPAVVTPEPDKDAARIVSLNAARLLSPQTAQQQLGLDPQHEAANFKAAEPAPQMPQPGQDGGEPGGGAADLLGLGESESWVSDPVYSLLSEAGRQGLVQKQVTDKNGRKSMRWVRPGDAKKADPRAGKADEKKNAVTAIRAALSDPAKADPKELAAHLARLTVAEIDALNKDAGVRGGRLKADKLDKFLAHVKAKAATPAKPDPADGGHQIDFDADDRGGAAAVVTRAGIAKAMASAKTADARAEVAAEFMSAHGADGGEVKAHGMTAGEPTRQLVVDGVAVHWTDATFDAAAQTIANMAAGDVPPALWAATGRVIHTAQKNGKDDYWRAKYKNFTESAATGGDGTTVVYSAAPAGADILTHEGGHNLAKQVWGKTTPASGSEYAKAYVAEKPVTAYAENSAAEDFAEAVRMYAESDLLRNTLKARFPKKYQAVHNLLKGK
jgi:hypothetical protein